MMRAVVWAGLALAVAGAAWADTRVSRKVYFDWGVTEVNAEGRKVIEGIAVQAKTCEHNGVRVIGHADTSHDDQTSADLSKARGNAVRDLLVAKGVANSAISVQVKGENVPDVPTADGVKEAKNRRVEIVLVCD